jgi:hypothetical protein
MVRPPPLPYPRPGSGFPTDCIVGGGAGVKPGIADVSHGSVSGRALKQGGRMKAEGFHAACHTVIQDTRHGCGAAKEVKPGIMGSVRARAKHAGMSHMSTNLIDRSRSTPWKYRVRK